LIQFYPLLVEVMNIASHSCKIYQVSQVIPSSISAATDSHNSSKERILHPRQKSHLNSSGLE